jgi:uncharacterized protein
MKFRIHQLDLPPGYTAGQLHHAVVKALRCRPAAVREAITIRRSVDARGRSPRMTVTAEAEVAGSLAPGLRNVEPVGAAAVRPRPAVRIGSGPQPLVVGAGPAGLMAAFALAETGLRPILIERGEPVEARARRVASFWEQGELHAESNVLFGEGGAGLFSDGKLTSRSKDRLRLRRFLEILVECGAPSDILVDAEPHLGSDVLHALVPALRRRIQDRGGVVRFGARLERLDIENGAVRGALVSGEPLRTDVCVLATGHSARDIYDMLDGQGVALEAKPFAVGVRLEIPQHRIDVAQWGGPVPILGKASFRLTRRAEGSACACYTFCMCPGGCVIACASAAGLLTTNGMSLSRRDRPFGNAAFLVPVGRPESGGSAADARAGIAFQRKMEAAAFAAGGSDYSLPAQRLTDYLDGQASKDLPTARSCARARPADVRGLLPEFVDRTLRSAAPKMLRSLRGVRLEEALLYAAETRSSSPVRVVRDDNGQSAGLRGLYPCGEGAGYAGGIVSAGMDGLRIAETIAAG